MQRKIITVLFKAIDRAMNMGMEVCIYIICVLNVYFETQNLQYNVYYSVNDVAYTFCDTKLHGNYHSVRDVITHTEEKPIKCNICDQCQWISNKQVKHLETHTEEKPCQCNIRAINLTVMKSYSKYNKWTHTREKSYQCSLCDRDHSGEKPYQCDTCDGSLKSGTNLGTHQCINKSENLLWQYKLI